MAEEEIARALAALERLAGDGAPTASAETPPAALAQFSVVSVSPLAPESVEIVAKAPTEQSKPAFAVPRALVASPASDPVWIRQELAKSATPIAALERVGVFPGGGRQFVFPPHDARPSRLLTQLPMAAPRKELVPQRKNLVLDPLKLEYEFRAVDTSHTGADAGFSSALTKQDEYARGKMSNKPFAPGGDSLAELEAAGDADTVVGSDAFRLKMLASPQEQRRNALVLAEDEAALADEAILDELVFDIPTLGGGLRLGDVQQIARFNEQRRKERAEASAVATAADEAVQREIDAVGENPETLLKPYFAVASDADHVAAVRSIVLEEKAANAMRQTADENATVGLDQLLRDLEDDDELAELGFHLNSVDDDEEKSERVENEVGAVDARTSMAISSSTKVTSAVASEDDNSEPEVELEILLNSESASSGNILTKIASHESASTEWASIARTDVRNFHNKVPEMAIKYKFELDTFQKECVIHLERHECVFVAAHTSAGKTVIAEYAIAMSQKHMTRTIYTSPIKALSNQKYRDFRTTFGAENVGLITGDVSINPEASCLVMTTEILRSMLYRGADVIRDIEWVIFDEIHYINDSERGVVWEEVIIMLPEHIGMVFLSATTPNHLEFSDWIGRTKKKKIHVISTLKRPVPLQHFLYAGKELFKLFDASSGYLPGAYGAAKAKLLPASDKSKAGGGSSGGRGGGGRGGGGSSANARSIRTSGGDQSEWTKLINSLNDKALLPVVVFAFSKRLCEESANKLNKLDLSSPSERSEIHLFIETSVQRLQGSDRELPQVLTMKEMLKRGIGVHHGGLLPIIKEMVEILFGRGLVKVLFSTETFAMGVNMPARTVVFNGIRKHDGKNFRDLLPGEYTQMAGRAGRRGLDSVGTVIIACWNDVPEPTSLRTMLAGKATTLTSQFRLTYNMILNLLRVEVLTVEDMMKRSFSEFHTQKALASRNIPQLITKGKMLLKKLEQALVEEYPHLHESGELAQIQAFYQLKRQKQELEKKLTKWILSNNAQAAKTAIAPGRIVALNVKGLNSNQLGLVVRTNALSGEAGGRSKISFESYQSESSGENKGVFKSITVICLCPDEYKPPQPELEASSNAGNRQQSSGSAFGGQLLRKKDDDEFMLGRMGKQGSGSRKAKDTGEFKSQTTASLLGSTYAVLDVPESCVESVTGLIANKVNTKTLVASSSKKELASAVEFLVSLDKGTGAVQHAAVPFVDVVGELRINDLEVVTGYGRWQDLYSAVLSHPCATDASANSQTSRVLSKVDKIFKLKDYLTRMLRELSNDSLSLFPDFQQRLSVLKRLGYISEENVVQVKGRVACEINTCEEVVLTEMIFENVLANLEPEEIVAVLSALIFQEKSQSEPTLTPRLEAARDTVKKIAESLGLIQLEQHLEIDPAVFCKGALNFGLSEVVYEWARGMPFKELCQLTDVQEGSIVRCITRLDEVCREVRNAARVIGDPRLYRKMEVASESIKRDVVFASSLYLT